MAKNFSVKSVAKYDTDISVLVSSSHPYGFDYIKINADLDSKTGKIMDMSFSYCVLTNPEDMSARWVNRDRAISNVGEDAIIAGEKLLARNVRNLKKLVKAGKLHPAFAEMNVKFKEIVNHYHTDFTWHDMIQLALHPNKKFVWCARDCGTELYFEVCDWMKACDSSGDKTRIWFVWSIQAGLVQIKSDNVIYTASRWLEDFS